jgi:hypothetical protein
MRFDMHVHVVGNGTRLEDVDRDVFFNPSDNHHWFTRILYQLLEDDLDRFGADLDRDGAIATAEYLESVFDLFVSAEEIDRMVLLAIDGVFSPETGELMERQTDLWVSNRFLAASVAELNQRLESETKDGEFPKRFFFAGSVNPNRRDWYDELEIVLAEPDAVAMKLIPSAHHVDLMDARHDPFFDRMIEVGMPLLCHVGPEYSFPEGIRNRRLDYFRRLERVLDRGLTVIAAHCATPVFPLIDRDDVEELLAFMERINTGGEVRLWADTSALSLSTRIPLISRIRHLFPPDWLVHGSDFPIPIDGWPHLPLLTGGVTPAEYLRIVKTTNPFDRDVRIKRAVGFDESILANSARVLRLPPT